MSEPSSKPIARRNEPRRRSTRGQQPTPAPWWRKPLQALLLFVAVVLVVDGLFGDRGLLETIRARRQYSTVVRRIEYLNQENARLREEARRLREDPAAIEAIARRELGLIRRGELLVIVKDLPSSPKR